MQVTTLGQETVEKTAPLLVTCDVQNVAFRRLLLDEKFRFEFPEISIDKFTRIFRKFRRRGQPCEVYWKFWNLFTGNYFAILSIYLFSQNCLNVRLNGSLFGNWTIFGFFWNFSQEISVPFVPVSKEWKASSVHGSKANERWVSIWVLNKLQQFTLYKQSHREGSVAYGVIAYRTGLSNTAFSPRLLCKRKTIF